MGRRRGQYTPSASTHWQNKIDPLFVWAAQRHKRITQLCLSNSSKDRDEGQRLLRYFGSKQDKEHHKQVRDYERRTGKKLPQYDFVHEVIFGPGPEITIEEFILTWLCWRSYSVPIRQLISEDGAGNPHAGEKLLRLFSIYNRWRFGQLDLNTMRFKGNSDHHVLIEFGLSLGLGRLSGDELADCFDELCPCGQEHSPQGLKKLRTRKTNAVFRAAQPG